MAVPAPISPTSTGNSFTDNRIIYDLAAGLISVVNPAGNTQIISGVENLYTSDAVRNPDRRLRRTTSSIANGGNELA